MTIVEFKQLLDIPADASCETIQSRFSCLAEALFRDFQIEKGNAVYDFLEIEFYFKSPAHQDDITYPRQCPAGMWYFHPSGVDISFASDGNHYGGILLRSVVRVTSEPEVIAGPIRLVDHLFDCLDITGNDIFNQCRLVPKLQPDASCLIETAPREIPVSKQNQAIAEPYCYYVRSRHNCNLEWKSVDSLGRSLYYRTKPWLRKAQGSIVSSLDTTSSIGSSKVRQAVYNRINFLLPQSTWKVIDDAFGDCWNNVFGMGGDIYFDQLFDFVNERLKEKHILLLSDNLAHILTIMLDYIEMAGGFLDDPRCPNYESRDKIVRMRNSCELTTEAKRNEVETKKSTSKRTWKPSIFLPSSRNVMRALAKG